MYKKRGSLFSCGSKKSQVTLFIIVGLMILFLFLGLLGLSASLQRQQLLNAKERIYSGIFSKEALRIYVDRCLKEGMEQGLRLLGQQGRIWQDQPGGREQFVEGFTGVTVGAERVFYGIVDDSVKKYPSRQLNAYPCLTDENSPAFCSYGYPNTNLLFGALKLDRRFIQADLERFLTAHTVACVEQLVKSEINQVAELETSPDVKFKVALNSDVITVKVNYPLKLTAGKGEFFHISQFDFTYPSDFDQLLTAAVLFPLRNDQKYVDFDFQEQSLVQPSFTYRSEAALPGFCENGLCQQSTRSAQYEALGLHLAKTPLANDDDLYQFTLSKDKIIPGSSGEYIYQFVRQNRPPALDYVHRKECPASGYDYLVLQGDPVLGTVYINPNAFDPDEDQPLFSFEKPAEFPESEPSPDSSSSSKFFLGVEKVLSEILPKETPYLFKVKASDANKEDWQEVRVLVDKPLITNIKINSPFTEIDSPFTGVEAHKVNDKYVLSREDPYFLDLTYQTSVGNLKSREVTLEYVNDRKDNSFGHRFVAGQTDNCFSFPAERSIIPGTLTVGGCGNLDFYNDPRFINQFDFEDQIQNPSRTFLEDSGTYSLKATASYCGVEQAFSSNEVKVEVKGCIPYRNPGHPYSYPNHKNTFSLKEDGSTNFNDQKEDQEINPFLATHACCYGDINHPNGNVNNPFIGDLFSQDNFNKGEWRLAPAGIKCYEDPKPGCYGRIEGFTTKAGFSGYVLETQSNTCDGRRGNVCLGGRESVLLGGELKCGNSEQYPSCRNIPPDSVCKNTLAFGYVDSNSDQKKDTWCSGKMGCEIACTESVVAEPGGFINSKEENYDLNILANTNKITQNSELKVHCGCSSTDLNPAKLCDNNFDGKFKGTCRNDGPRGIKCMGDD